VDVYTLEVDPEQAERLALAAAEGKLQFALRNITDQETVLTKGATVSRTLSSLRGVDPVPPVPPPKKRPKVRNWGPKRTRFTVETIKGSKRSKEKFKK
jgi:pilus assembly protein CpaB